MLKTGFINDLAFTSDGSEVICGVGQEHKYGRWWKIGDAKNSIVRISIKYSTE
jgi:ribosomal RNA-processing protein 9